MRLDFTDLMPNIKIWHYTRPDVLGDPAVRSAQPDIRIDCRVLIGPWHPYDRSTYRANEAEIAELDETTQRERVAKYRSERARLESHLQHNRAQVRNWVNEQEPRFTIPFDALVTQTVRDAFQEHGAPETDLIVTSWLELSMLKWRKMFTIED